MNITVEIQKPAGKPIQEYSLAERKPGSVFVSVSPNFEDQRVVVLCDADTATVFYGNQPAPRVLGLSALQRLYLPATITSLEVQIGK